jgi:hypothetical protein
MDGPTGEEIAHRAQEFKIVVLAQQLSLVAITHPALPLLRVHQSLTGVGPQDDIPLVLQDGPEHDELQFSIRDILTTASRLPLRYSLIVSLRTTRLDLDLAA